MKRRSIVLLDSAKQDMRELVFWLKRTASASIAHRYLDKVQGRIATLRDGAERGTLRDTGRGIRIIGILPHTSLVFSVDESHVYILRVLHGGQSLDLKGEAEEAPD